MNQDLVTKERPKIKYLPGSGMHILVFEGNIVWLYRSVKDIDVPPSPYTNVPTPRFLLSAPSFLFVFGWLTQSLLGARENLFQL